MTSNYGRISFHNADAIDRLPAPTQSRRHDFLTTQPEQSVTVGKICPDCNLRRTDREFRIGDAVLLNCQNCWPKYGRKLAKKAGAK